MWCGVVWCGVMNFILLTWSSKASTDVLTLWPVSALVSKYFKPKFSAKALASFSSTALCSSKSALFPIRTKNRKKLVCQCNPSTSCQKVNLTESRKPHLSNKTWRCGHSNESSRWVHSNGTVCVIVNFMFHLNRETMTVKVSKMNKSLKSGWHYIITLSSSLRSNGYLRTRWTGLIRNDDKSQHLVCSLQKIIKH